MPRTPNKPTTEHTPRAAAEAFALPAPIADPQLELFYLLGHLRGKIATADRIAELVLMLQAKWAAEVEKALQDGRDGN
jgi:hypothetical protein